MAKLIIENGIGVTGANVYASVAEFQSFAELNGINIEDFDEDQLAIYLVRGT